MDVHRRGKIARLPHQVRQQLNARLRDHEPQVQLVTWLNGLPEVRKALADYFDGQPITPQNLSRWHLGGYQAWLDWQDDLEAVRRLRDGAEELRLISPNGLLEDLSTWLKVQLVKFVEQNTYPDDPKAELDHLAAVGNAFLQLQRGDHTRDLLQLRQQKAARQGAASLEERFLAYARRPDIKEHICGPELTPEQKDRGFRDALFTDFVFDPEQDKVVHVSEAGMIARRDYARYMDLPWDGPEEDPLTEEQVRKIMMLDADHASPGSKAPEIDYAKDIEIARQMEERERQRQASSPTPPGPPVNAEPERRYPTCEEIAKMMTEHDRQKNAPPSTKPDKSHHPSGP